MNNETYKISPEQKRAAFIARVKGVWGDTYDFDHAEYTGATSKIKLTCEKHGDFEQWVHNLYRHKGCPKCGYENRKPRARKVGNGGE
jgi:Zn finger protein HypA/HybF involved in hydrogenase expression